MGDEDQGSDVFFSDDQDEKRSYTPQPRQQTMMGGLKQQANKLTKGMPPGAGRPQVPGGYSVSNQGLSGLSSKNMIGRANFGGLNRSNTQDLSIVNNKSEMISDISQHDLSAYVSREKKAMNNDLPKANPNTGYFGSLFTKTEENLNNPHTIDEETSTQSNGRNLALGCGAMTGRSAQHLGTTLGEALSTHRVVRGGGNHQDVSVNGEEAFSYKALMEMKGSKCTCLPQFNYGALKSQSCISQAKS